MWSLLTICLLAAAIPSSAMVTRSPNSMNAIGATYFTTNDPSGNYVISSAFGTDGNLFSQHATPTNGYGSRGMFPLPGADAIFSTGVVKASPLGVLAVANPGSDTISLFSISESDPSLLTPIGEPFWSRGEFPVSVAFNTVGDVLCVLNTGAVNGVSCFNVDKTNGLTSIPNTTRYLHLNQTSPVSGPLLGSASHVIFSEADDLLIVAVKGVNATTDAGYLAVWDVDENGLSQDFNRVTAPTGGFYPYSLMPIPGRNAFLVSDPAMGYDVFSNISRALNGGDHRDIGLGSYSRSIPGQLTTCWSAYSPISGNYYLSDLLSNRITEINLDDNLQSSIVNYISFENNFGPLDMAVLLVDGHAILYVLSTTPKAVDVFSVDEPGNAVHIQRYDYTESIGVTLDTSYLAGMEAFIWSQ